MKSPELQMRKVPEADYLLNQYRLGREILEQCQVHKELLITGWRTSLGKLNFLNDSSWTAAKILHTALTGYGVLPSLPLEYTLDLMVEGAEESGILHAMEGMMTVHGLRKPSFYAFRFLKHLDQFFLYRDEHVLVTASAEGYVQIVLQNSAPLSHQYYLYSAEISPQPSPIPDGFFESKEPYPVRLRFTGVENGKWLMKTRTVNEELGNVFHAWMVLNYDDPSFMGRDEQELLCARSVPDIRGNTLTSRNGILDVTVTMGPNEIRHIHLLPVGQ
jgi:beta-xylosidase